MKYPAWLGQLGKKKEALRKVHGLYPAKDGWYKTVALKKRYIAKPMPLADAVGIVAGRVAEVRGTQAERPTRLSGAGTSIEHLVEMFIAHLWQRHRTGQPRKMSRRTYDDYLDTMARFTEAVGPAAPAASVGTDWFTRFSRTIAHKAVSSRRRDTIYVTAFFNWAGPGRHALGFYKEPVQFGPDFVKPDAAALQAAMDATSTLYSPADLAGALAAVRACPLLLAAGLLGLNCAFLPSEVTALPLSAVDLETGVLDDRRHKTSVGRKAVLMPETLAAVREYLAVRPAAAGDDGPLLVRDDGLPFDQRRSSGSDRAVSHTNSVGVYWRQVTGLPFKGLRTTFATMADGLEDQRAVDMVMGHAATSVRAKHYVKQFDPERLRRVVEHVWTRCGVAVPPRAGEPIGAAEMARLAVAARAASARPRPPTAGSGSGAASTRGTVRPGPRSPRPRLA